MSECKFLKVKLLCFFLQTWISVLFPVLQVAILHLVVFGNLSYGVTTNARCLFLCSFWQHQTVNWTAKRPLLCRRCGWLGTEMKQVYKNAYVSSTSLAWPSSLGEFGIDLWGSRGRNYHISMHQKCSFLRVLSFHSTIILLESISEPQSIPPVRNSGNEFSFASVQKNHPTCYRTYTGIKSGHKKTRVMTGCKWRHR